MKPLNDESCVALAVAARQGSIDELVRASLARAAEIATEVQAALAPLSLAHRRMVLLAPLLALDPEPTHDQPDAPQ